MSLDQLFPHWTTLQPRTRQVLLEKAQLRQAEKGLMIHGGQKDCTGLLLVKSGQLRAFMLSKEGREMTLYRLLERDLCLFSASCMIHSLQINLLVEAAADSEYYLIPAPVYQALAEADPALNRLSSEIMGDRFSEVMWLMEQILWNSMDRRLADLLLEERALEAQDNLSLTHEALARHLGTHREVVTRLLQYFQKEGLVSLSRGRIHIVAPEALEALARE